MIEPPATAEGTFPKASLGTDRTTVFKGNVTDKSPPVKDADGSDDASPERAVVG